MTEIQAVTVMIQLAECPTEETLGALERTLGRVPGVLMVEAVGHLPRMVRVDYDPARATAEAVLAVVTGAGHEARLVGF